MTKKTEKVALSRVARRYGQGKNAEVKKILANKKEVQQSMECIAELASLSKALGCALSITFVPKNET
jgi:hypothetical protein